MILSPRLKNRSHIDDPEERKLIKSILDIINPPVNQQAESGTDSTEQTGNAPENTPKIVLHIDDDPDDREFVHEAIKLIDPSLIVHEAQSGEDGIEFLTRAKSLGNLPCLIILDINMPEMNGFDTYNEIKKDDTLKAVPAVIFTTSAVFKGNQNTENENLPIFIKPDNTRDFLASIRKILTHGCL
jgi:CheY-like chemotaxis protein